MKEKGILVHHIWRLSAIQSIMEGTTITGKPTARFKSGEEKGGLSFPDEIQIT